jgi:hypothetical protein
MRVEHLEILVEEPSMETALRLLLPKIIEYASFEIYPHQCKEELIARLPQRLRGYRSWLPASWRILVIVDRDDDDCRDLKEKLEKMARAVGLKTKTMTHGGIYAVVNRLAVEELEAWYFGDWEAVQCAYPRVSHSIPAKAKFRNPDGIKGGTWEALESILNRAGYFAGGLRKIDAARAISSHMVPERNRSRSFQVLRSALLEMASCTPLGNYPI